MQMKEIEQKMVELQNEFNAKKNDKKLPKNFISLFIKAFLSVPPMTHKIHSNTVKNITSKKVAELTKLEVRQASNVIVLAKPTEIWGDDFDAALEGFAAMQQLIVSCNIEVSEFEKELQEKKLNLINLSGATLGSSKIISN